MTSNQDGWGKLSSEQRIRIFYSCQELLKDKCMKSIFYELKKIVPGLFLQVESGFKIIEENSERK